MESSARRESMLPMAPTPSRQTSLGLGARPEKFLKRASNLLLPSGELSTPALHSAVSRYNTDPEETYTYTLSRESTDERDVQARHGRRHSESNLGASIRRKLSQVKSSGLKSISGGVRRASTSRAKVQRAAEDVQERGKYERSLSFPEARVLGSTSKSSLSPGICEASTSTSDSDLFEEDRNMNSEDVKVPLLLQQGTPMTKISAKKKKTVTFRVDPDQGYILWDSKKSGIIAIENIKEIRSGADARYYREQFQLSQDYEDRWLTIIYIVDGRYKTLHAVAPSRDVFQMWNQTLRDLYAVRQDLMSGLGHVDKRQSVWERRYWKGADEQKDDKLSFEEVEKMCKRLNINFSQDDLMRRFKEADIQRRGYLDFDDFRKFVKLLKDRPEITRLYKKLVAANKGLFDFSVFENFMVQRQKSLHTQQELELLFRKHACPLPAPKEAPPPELPPTPPSDPSLKSITQLPASATPGAEPSAQSAAPDSHQPTPSHSPVPSTPSAPPAGSSMPSPSTPSHPPPNIAEPFHVKIDQAEEEQKPLSDIVMSLDAFTSYLLSTDNSAFDDQHGKIWQDMTKPLPEYYISSSHNTYLVGHQLVGVSTIEGYIRALLHSCRSVELDIYDGETEPVIYHGKTLTSKVPLRDICRAIAKYAFVASPYPVIISAEVHCSLAQQALIASIMRETFGDTLVAAPVEGRPTIKVLPSPEDLRGRILLKAKNLYVSEKEGLKEKKVTVDTESSSTDTSTSDSEFIRDVRQELKHEMDAVRNVSAVKEIRDEIKKAEKMDAMKEIKDVENKARSLYDKVRRKKSPPPAPKRNSPPNSVSLALAASSSTTLQPQVAVSSTTVLPLEAPKVKMSFELVALLVYTVGVKCRGFNKKETYAPEHVFSLSERTANKVLKQGMFDLVKHNKTHIVRIYPSGTRLNSSNFEPHKYWSAGAQLVAINWQTFDLGYMINHAMFQRNGRAGYVLKPPALRNPNRELFSKRTKHFLDVKIISAQQLPRRKDSVGREIIDNSVVDPYVEVSIHVPDWTHSPFLPEGPAMYNPSVSPTSAASTIAMASSTRAVSYRTCTVKNNGFNPVWEEKMSLPFDCVADMLDLIFVRFQVKDESIAEDDALAVYCISLGSLQQGYRHLPLHDAQLSQYLFSTLFVHVGIRNV